MAAVRSFEREVVREPGFQVDPEWVREQRAEWRERILQDVEDDEHRATVGTGEDWTESVNE